MGKVTKDMGLLEIAQNYPESLEVFSNTNKFSNIYRNYIEYK